MIYRLTVAPGVPFLAALLAVVPLLQTACGGKASGGNDRHAAEDAGAPGGSGGSGAGGTGGSDVSGAGGAAPDGAAPVTGGAPQHDARPPLEFGTCEMADAANGGWVLCEKGFLHRATRGQCSSSVPRPEAVSTSGAFSPDQVECRSDADCAHLPHGYCFGTYWVAPTCVPGCVEDSDCGTGEVCFCDEPVGRCVPTADCAVDDECGDGSYCTTYTVAQGCGPHPVIGVACQTEGDACTGSEDCPAGQSSPLCGYDPDDGRRVCGAAAGGCGGR